MVPGLLLPPAFANALSPTDVLVSPADTWAAGPGWHCGLPRWDHYRDGSALMVRQFGVNAPIIVSTITDELGELASVAEQRRHDARVIDLSPRQFRRDDLAFAMSSSPGRTQTNLRSARDPHQIRTRRFPPSGSSADRARGVFYAHRLARIVGAGSGYVFIMSTNRGQVMRVR